MSPVERACSPEGPGGPGGPEGPVELCAPTTAGAAGELGLSFWNVPSVRQDACRHKGTIRYFQKEA